MTLTSGLGLATAALILVAAPARAQARAQMQAHNLCASPGERRLDASTCAVYRVILDSARKRKLPTDPLEDKALQGIASDVDGPAIVASVLKLENNLAVAKATLGSNSTDKELKAAAQVLDAGATPHDLALLRAAAPPKRNLETALTVLEELVVQVPMFVAIPDMQYLLRVNRSDADLQSYQLAVQSQIKRGGDPEVIANTAARAFPPIPHN